MCVFRTTAVRPLLLLLEGSLLPVACVVVMDPEYQQRPCRSEEVVVKHAKRSRMLAELLDTDEWKTSRRY
jgi:hypothetical protein